MLASIDPKLIPLIIGIVIVLLAQYILAVVSVSKLFRCKPKFGPDVMWHMIIQLLIVIGPIFFLIVCGNKKRQFITAEKDTAKEEEA